MTEGPVREADALFVLLPEFVLVRVRERISHPPEEADELGPIGVGLELEEDGPAPSWR